MANTKTEEKILKVLNLDKKELQKSTTIYSLMKA